MPVRDALYSVPFNAGADPLHFSALAIAGVILRFGRLCCVRRGSGRIGLRRGCPRMQLRPVMERFVSRAACLRRAHCTHALRCTALRCAALRRSALHAKHPPTHPREHAPTRNARVELASLAQAEMGAERTRKGGRWICPRADACRRAGARVIRSRTELTPLDVATGAYAARRFELRNLQRSTGVVSLGAGVAQVANLVPQPCDAPFELRLQNAHT